MKATPAMVVNVCAQMGIAPSTVQRVLDIALADVPERSFSADAVRALRSAEVRIAELEAKLANGGPEVDAQWHEHKERADDAEAKLSLARARRADLLEVAAEWKEKAKVLVVRDPTRSTLQDCAEDLRVLAERLPV